MRCWFPWVLFAVAIADPILNPQPDTEKNMRHVVSDDNDLAHTTFYYARTEAKLDYVSDSGKCETTPGVHRHSGYATVGKGMHMFFWMFEARHNPETAPLVSNLADGPGGSIEVMIMGGRGPCIINDTELRLNSLSYNEHANVLFVDQPLDTGYSYGSNPINSTEAAAEYLWKFLQAFFAEFDEYRGREFGIAGGIYAGHTTPAFGNEISRKNRDIQVRFQPEGFGTNEPVD